MQDNHLTIVCVTYLPNYKICNVSVKLTTKKQDGGTPHHRYKTVETIYDYRTVHNVIGTVALSLNKVINNTVIDYCGVGSTTSTSSPMGPKMVKIVHIHILSLRGPSVPWLSGCLDGTSRKSWEMSSHATLQVTVSSMALSLIHI